MDGKREVMDYHTNVFSFTILPATACQPGGAGDVSLRMVKCTTMEKPPTEFRSQSTNPNLKDKSGKGDE